MFGKPYYDKNWGLFYAYTPDDFIVSPKYRDNSVPSRMLLELMKTKNPETGLRNKNNYNFIVDVFDRRIEWRRKALLSVGCNEPKFDYGVILAKPLNGSIMINKVLPWILPGRCIIAPVPSPKQV